MSALVAFPGAYADHSQTIRIQRSAYADALRTVRKTRDMWRAKEREAVFSKAGMALYAEATQRAAYLLRFHIRLSVHPKPMEDMPSWRS